MHPISACNKNVLRLSVLAASVVLALFFWQGRAGFTLWDEGYLWYGAQRVMLGEVPIRDFSAYDPGRYYWSAALMWAWGDNGIMALRGATAIFQAMGLFAGLFLISRTAKAADRPDRLYLLLSAAVLVVWMFPRHKLFDISLSISLIGALAFLVENPSRKRYFFTGACIGLAAIFGRNHGIYGVAGSVGVFVWLNIKRTNGPGILKNFASWLAGVVVGFTPMLLMTLLVPGFALAFWEGIRFLFEIKATNLPLPVPWPWRVNLASSTVGDAARGVLIGLFFIGTVVFGVLSIMWVVWQKLQNRPVSPVLVAASMMALPYAHYAYSRADVGHLALGIFPLLIGCLAILSAQAAMVKWPAALALCTASFWVMHIFHPGWQCHVGKRCVSMEISGSYLQMDRGTASDIALLRSLADLYARNEGSFIATPVWPGAYPLLERKSPMWEIYALFPRPREFERAEIERIKSARPGFVLVFDLPLDGRDELRFRNTHPLTHQYILDNFEPLPDSPNPAYRTFKAKDAAQ
ncbi:hypothetical protein [Polaromonas sp. YR568]|uniref:hypothetical protein n=1 Tax=Polaromonas sp. YR568 TaxID=1855301 RepID=UPI00398C0526